MIKDGDIYLKFNFDIEQYMEIKFFNNYIFRIRKYNILI